MFDRLATVRIKAAEKALAEGQIDEAFAIASSPDLKDERPVRALLQKLGKQFAERGQERLLSRQFDEALADFDRAARCGQDSKKIAEWRRRAADAREHDRRIRADQAAALVDGRARLNAGSIAGAAAAKDRAPVRDAAVSALSQAIGDQADRAEAALAAARRALKESDLLAAVGHVCTARRLHSRLDGLADVEADVVEAVLKSAVRSFQEGRLSRATQELNVLSDLGRGRGDVTELREALRLAAEAGRSLAEDRYAKAGVLVGRLMQIGPAADWLQDVREKLAALETHRRALLEGPLGLLAGGEIPSAIAKASQWSDETASAPNSAKAIRQAGATLPPPPPADDGLCPRRILLRIDGIGSFLLLRGERIGIGRAGSHAADLELLSDLSERHAEIIRAGEDYFMVSSAGVELAGRSVAHALLQDGDRVRLGRRVRLTFRRPSLKSTTAALDLGDGVRTVTDARRVILWGGPILLGSSRECHIRLPSRIGGLVLIERGGRLAVKPMGPGGETTAVALGEVTAIGELRLSASAISSGSGIGRVVG